MSKTQPLFVRGDLDGFFGLMVDNLVQILLIVTFCRELLQFPDALVFGKVLPGVAISLLVGNLYYARQARKLAEKTGRDDVTALPYGINTPSVFAYVFLVMLPVWFAGGDLDPTARAERAWQAGLVACFLSGVIETLGSLIGPWIRKVTPRAALLAALSGIAVTFISMDFALRIFRAPLIGLIGLGFVLAHYMSRRGLPFGLPAGGLAVAIGTVMAVVTDFPQPQIAADAGGFAFPLPVIGDLIAGFQIEGISSTWSVIFTMGLLNVVGTLQNVESAEAAGDAYELRPTMVVNGLGTVVASIFGSCFPTTVYIGHPGWKAMGARSAYSTMNGIFWIVVVLGGLAVPIARYVPIEAGAAIVVWIAIIITAQAFQATPRAHAPAVALGLFPALGAWVVIAMQTALRQAGVTPTAEVIGKIDAPGGFPIDGALHLWSGFLFTATIWAAIGANLVDHRFRAAAYWSLAAAGLSALGLIHGFALTDNGPVEVLGFGAAGWAIPTCYVCFALIFLVQGARGLRGSGSEAEPEPETA